MTQVLKIDVDNPDEDVLVRASDALAQGELIVLPTDTVYGVAVAASSPDTLERVFEAKRRDREKAIPWLVGGVDALDVYGVDVPSYAYRLAERWWPGALTLVVRASDRVAPEFRAADGTIALRMPNAPYLVELIDRLGCPICASSANSQGLPAPASADELERRIMDEATIVLDGGTAKVGSASTVCVCTGAEPLVGRDSAIPEDEIMEVAHVQV